MKKLLTFCLVLLLSTGAFAQTIEKFEAYVKESVLVVAYSLAGNSGETFTVELYYTKDDGHSLIGPISSEGALGTNISPGYHEVYLQLGTDVPDLSTQFELKLLAYEGPSAWEDIGQFGNEGSSANQAGTLEDVQRTQEYQPRNLSPNGGFDFKILGTSANSSGRLSVEIEIKNNTQRFVQFTFPQNSVALEIVSSTGRTSTVRSNNVSFVRSNGRIQYSSDVSLQGNETKVVTVSFSSTSAANVAGIQGGQIAVRFDGRNETMDVPALPEP